MLGARDSSIGKVSNSAPLQKCDVTTHGCIVRATKRNIDARRADLFARMREKEDGSECVEVACGSLQVAVMVVPSSLML